MDFCRNCGTALDGGDFCPNCGVPVELLGGGEVVDSIQHSFPKTGLWKKVMLGSIVVVAAILIITRLTAVVDKPCDWCKDRPSVAYEVSDGSYSYVCKDCRKKCAWCGDKADRHYENLAGMMVFVCDECYEGIN